MITIEIDIVLSHVRGDYPAEKLDDAISWFVDGFWMSDAYKKGWWDGKKHLFSILKDERGRFPTGLLDVIKRTLLREGHDIDEIIDNRPEVHVEPYLPALNGIDLELWKPGGVREYQADCIFKAVQAKRGVIWLPTNAGKTEVLIGIAAVLNKKTAFILHSLELLKQTKE